MSRLPGFGTREQLSPIPSLMVVHEDPMIRHQITTILRREKFLVDEVEDYDQAVDWLAYCLEDDGQRNPPDIIVASMRSPRMNGVILLEELRNLHWPTPFILITEEDGNRFEDHVKRLGSVFVFRYPFGTNDFLTAILYFLARHKRFKRIAGSIDET